MRRLPEMENIWRNYEHVGKYKPTIRATITRPQMKLFTYALKGLNLSGTLNTTTGAVTFEPVTIQKTDTATYEKFLKDPTSIFQGVDVTEVYSTHWVHDDFQPRELPNIKSCSWSRSIDQDAADMTLTMLNVQQIDDDTNLGGARPLVRSTSNELSSTKDSVYDMDQLGYFSPSRGKTTDSNRWGHNANDWTGLLMPDNIIKTFQGYGVDYDVEPESDPNLAQTGVWLIDDVTFNATGSISIRCRDLGRLLLEQGFEAPVLPNDFNPVGFKAWNVEDLKRKVNIEETITKTETIKYEEPWSEPPGPSTRQPLVNPHSSTEAWKVGTNGDGGPGKVKDPFNYHGRGPQMTLDDNGATYWISVGNGSPGAPYAYEWVEFDLPGGTINEVMVDPIKSNYRCYISVMRDGQWLGTETINYREAGIGRNGSNIKFVAQQTVNQGRNTIKIAPVDRAQKLRVTLGNLQNWSANFGTPAYRAAIASVEAYATASHPATVTREKEVTTTSTQTTTKEITLPPGAVGENPGGGTARYSDYTDLVKLMCAWGGFYWPQDITEATSNSTNKSGVVEETGPFGDTVTRDVYPNFRKYTFDVPDTGVLGHVPGRVWGDFMTTGQSGPAEIGSSNFMAKSLREGINVIADTVSYNFWIDETGAVQWRYPNIDKIGNWVTDRSAGAARVEYVHEIDEKQILTDFTTTLSSRHIAELVILKNIKLYATKGYVSSGYNPNPTGLRRSVIWTDAEFLASDEEAKIMGDLIATRMLFGYRKNTVVVPGFPGLQIDDQVRIHERTTSDSFYHLISAIQSEHDNITGEWTMTLNTTWLGDTPEGRWTIPRRTRETRESTGVADQPVDSRGGRTLK